MAGIHSPEDLIELVFTAIDTEDSGLLQNTLDNLRNNYSVIFNELRDNRIRNPLVYAAKAGHLNLLKLMFNDYNFDKSSYGSILFADEEDVILEAPVLWTAATAGRLDVVKYLLKIGCNVNQATLTNSTPIRGACYDGYTDVSIVQHRIHLGTFHMSSYPNTLYPNMYC